MAWGITMALPPGEWTWLEITKLAFQLLTPIAVFVLGYLVTRQSRRLDEARWARQKVIEERIKAYGEVAKKLNDIYCYFLFIGPWKELSPQDVIERKRHCDAQMHTSRAYFSQELLRTYIRFIKMCFLEYAGADKDAPIRAHIESNLGNRRNAWQATKNQIWPPDWDNKFVRASDAAADSEIISAYETLIQAFHEELVIWDETKPASIRERAA
jgi:hypothetical protein